jgi:hypothetical protein
MIKAEREARMLSILDNAGVASIHGLSRRLGRVSEVTARRDIARLAAQGLLRRSRGGAARVETARPERPKAAAALVLESGPASGIEDADAIVLPPPGRHAAQRLSTPPIQRVPLGRRRLCALRPLIRRRAPGPGRPAFRRSLARSLRTASNRRSGAVGLPLHSQADGSGRTEGRKTHA